MSQTPATPIADTPGKTRDWIAVDQMVTRLTLNAPDDFERNVVRLAAELCGGPDTDVPGGGDVWKKALDDARESLHSSLVEDLDSKQPPTIDDAHPVTHAVTEAIEHLDIDDFTRERLMERLTEIVTTQTQTARHNERLVISDWLIARAERMGHGGSVVVEEQARALGSAAARLRNTIENEPPI